MFRNGPVRNVSAFSAATVPGFHPGAAAAAAGSALRHRFLAVGYATSPAPRGLMPGTARHALGHSDTRRASRHPPRARVTSQAHRHCCVSGRGCSAEPGSGRPACLSTRPRLSGRHGPGARGWLLLLTSPKPTGKPRLSSDKRLWCGQVPQARVWQGAGSSPRPALLPP